MDVEMRHLLPAVNPHVGQHAIPGRLQAKLLGYAPHGAIEPGNLRIGGASREIRQCDVGAAGDDERVGRRLRSDVVERDRPLVLVDAIGRDLAAQEFGEDVVWVVRAGAADGHGLLRIEGFGRIGTVRYTRHGYRPKALLPRRGITET